MLRFTLHKKFIPALLLTAVILGACKKLVEIGPPVNQVGLDQAFASDATATSAVLGVYNSTGTRSLILPMSQLPGLSANEMMNSVSSAAYDEFSTNSLTITNSLVTNTIWGYGYSALGQANAMLAGITRSNTLSPAVKSQLLGEVKTWRAFLLFELVNCFGDIPMPLTDDPIANATLPRTPAADVWKQIIQDLSDAQGLLTDAYPTPLRARVNRQTANALLARAYLYTKDYANAATTAGLVMNSGLYTLNKDLNSVFTNSSNEIIWQLYTVSGLSIYMTNQDSQGGSYSAAAGAVPAMVLTDTLYNSLEDGDLRKANWITPTVLGGTSWKFITKYKQRTLASGASTGTEYNVVLRLAEQYLIRAEARAQRNDLTGAIADVDSIRSRAGLPMLDNSLDKPALLLAIEKERKAELFAEWGHRWFDLKRTASITAAGKTRADDVIGGMRPATWSSTDILYPIPDAQRTANPALAQNPGY